MIILFSCFFLSLFFSSNSCFQQAPQRLVRMSLHPKLEHFEEDEDDDESEDEDYVPRADHVEEKAENSVAKYSHCYEIDY